MKKKDRGNLDRDDKGNSLVSSHANGYIIQVGRPKEKKIKLQRRTTTGAIILDLCSTGCSARLLVNEMKGKKSFSQMKMGR
jgi:hypothetical protein